MSLLLITLEGEPYPILLYINPWSDPGVWIGFLLMILLLTCQSLISAAEVAFFSVRQHELTKDDEEKNPATQRILRLMESPRYLLSTLLVAANFISISTIVASSYVLDAVLRIEYFEAFMSHDWAHNVKMIIEVGLVTFLLVLFGEVAPKLFASLNSLRIAKFMSGPVTIMRKVFHPISWVLVNTTSLIEKAFERKAASMQMSAEDISSAIDMTVANRSEGYDREVDILKGIVKFGRLTVTEIMTPRMDITSVHNTDGFTKLITIANESGFSRIPVWDESPDDIVGIIHTKDLLEHLPESDTYNWQDKVRPAYFIPESKKIDDLLEDFQTKRVHMAVVVDEFGGTVGVVTLEDIVEEIVGDIQDEFDDPEIEGFSKLDDHNYIFAGKTLLNDVSRVIRLEADFFESVRGDADTLAGLLLELNGAFPRAKAKITYKHLTFMPTLVSRRKIEQIQLTIGQSQQG